MIQLDSTAARKFAVHLEGYEGLGGELVKNGDFSEIGSDLVQNGDFAEIGSELITNGDFSAVPLGSELITNGDFAVSGTLTSNSWSLGWNSGDTGLSISDGALNLVNNGGGFVGRAYANNGVDSYNGVLEVGKTYSLTYEVTENIDSANLFYYAGSYVSTSKDVGVHTVEFTATKDFFVFRNGSSNTTIKIDNVSVKEQINLVTNSNFTDTGSDLIVNGIFDTTIPMNSAGSGWYSTTGALFNNVGGVDGMKVPRTTSSVYSIAVKADNSDLLTANTSYKISYEVLENNGSGGVYILAGAGTAVNGAITTGVTHTIYITSGADDYLRFYNQTNNSDYTITNVTCEELGEDWTLFSDVSVGEDKLICDNVAENTSIASQSGIVPTEKSVKVSYDVVVDSGAFRLLLGSGGTTTTVTTSGTYVFYETSGLYGTLTLQARSGGFDGSITNIVVQELGEDWSLFSNTEPIFNASGLTLNTSNGFDQTINQPSVISSGKSYKVTYQITAATYTTGSKFDYYDGDSYVNFPEQGVGTHTFYYTSENPASDRWYMKLRPGSGTDEVTLSSISVKEVGQDWTIIEGASGDTVTFGDSFAEFNKTDSQAVYLQQDYALSLGVFHKLKYTILSNTYTGGGTELGVSSVGAYGQSAIPSTVGTHTVYLKVTNTTPTAALRFYSNDTGGSLKITDISVQQLDPNGYWTIGGGWSIGDSKAIADGSQSPLNILSQNPALVTNKTYKISFDSNRISKTLFVRDSDNTTIYTLNTGTGSATNTFYTKWTGSGGTIKMYAYDYDGSITDVSIRLKNTGAVTLTLTNQLTEKETVVELTPLLSNGRYTEFSYQPTGLIEGMYLIKFTGDSTTYAETLAYITTGTPPLGESEYKEYTTGDDNPDYVYIP